MSNLFELKTTEAAAFLLEKAGGKMEYLKLIKLLYLADREAIHVNGLPITFDDYCSMINGPVLSRTYDWIKSQVKKGDGDTWVKHIQLASRYEVVLASAAGVSHLSDVEVEVLDSVFKEFNKFGKYELVDITHKLPEYKTPPTRSSVPISIRDVINAVESDEQEQHRLEEGIAIYKILNQA